MTKQQLQRIPPVAVAIAVATLFFCLPALNCLRFPRLTEIAFFESDTYYYLDVARYSQHLPFFSFDAQHATNGFHPLWQWVEYYGVKSGFLPLADNFKTLQRVFFLDLTLLSVGVGLFTWFCVRRLRNSWLALSITCPGVLWFLFSHNGFFFGWSNLNGMETGVEILFFGLTLLAFERFQSTGSATWLAMANVLAGFMVLARLDDVFFLLPLTVLTLGSRPVRMQMRLLAAAPPFLMVVAYMAYNRATVGILMPISGLHKAGWMVLTHLKTSGLVLLPYKHMWVEIYYHMLQMLVPSVVCAVYLIWRWRRRHLRMDLMLCVAVGVILKASYNFALVNMMLQGHWYYGPSILFANFLLVLAVDRAASQESLATLFPVRSGLYLWTFSTLMALIAFGSVMEVLEPNDGKGESAFYEIQESGATLHNMIAKYGDNRFIEFDDGEIAFASGVPSVSGFRLTGDLESVRALENGDFFELMEKRGVTLIACSKQYSPGTKDIHFDPHQLGMWGGLRESEFLNYYWKYVGSTEFVTFYRLTREP